MNTFKKIQFQGGKTHTIKEIILFRELFHPFHPVGLTKSPSLVAIVQQKHSKEGDQHHSHELDHPTSEIDIFKTNREEGQLNVIKGVTKISRFRTLTRETRRKLSPVFFVLLTTYA